MNSDHVTGRICMELRYPDLSNIFHAQIRVSVSVFNRNALTIKVQRPPAVQQVLWKLDRLEQDVALLAHRQFHDAVIEMALINRHPVIGDRFVVDLQGTAFDVASGFSI